MSYDRHSVVAGLQEAITHGEVGIQVAAYLGEELIVDEWAGTADEASQAPVTNDTLFQVFSVAKALVAVAIHMQADRGLLDLDAPIARVWPEYARNGKSAITVRDVLTHRSGVPQMPAELGVPTAADWETIIGYLADVTPVAPPGKRTIYHPLSYGYILGEVVRRVDPAHRLLDEFVRGEICDAFDIPDLWLGAPAAQGHRMAATTLGAGAPTVFTPNPFRSMSIPATLTPGPDTWNGAAIRQSLIPSANLALTARSGAKFFSILANRGALGGRRLLSEGALLNMTEPRPRPEEVDEGIGRPMWLGVGGLRIGGVCPPAERCVGTGKHILAQKGIDGSIGWADMDTGLAVMIAHNRMVHGQEPFAALSDLIRHIAATKQALNSS